MTVQCFVNLTLLVSVFCVPFLNSSRGTGGASVCGNRFWGFGSAQPAGTPDGMKEDEARQQDPDSGLIPPNEKSSPRLDSGVFIFAPLPIFGGR